MTDRRRYARQMIVAEVGDGGQMRLEASAASVGGLGLCHEVASAYASRAGFARILPGTIDEGALAPSFLHETAPRAVVAGSRAALLAMRGVLLDERTR